MRPLLLVAVGGAAGSAARAAITLALPGMPLAATMGVNVVGALVLGWVMVMFAGRRQHSSHPDLHLLVGTGFCGGFTTYSALALQVAERAGSQPLLAVGYAVATLLLGAFATLAGMLLAERTAERTAGR